MEQFYLGTHKPQWLADPRFANVPLFVSNRTLSKVKKLPRAAGKWALDSGGFSELQIHGRWTTTPAEYAAEVRRYRDEIGGLAWAAPQDWMCEPIVRAGGKAGGVEFKGTGLSTEEHQKRTVENLLELRSIAPDLPFVPVLQGWTTGDYLQHVEQYADAGVDLAKEPLVGLGSVCRRQGTMGVGNTLAFLTPELRLHGFGFKSEGLRMHGGSLASADSLAWSFNARKNPPLPGHDRPGEGRRTGHESCANCAEYALEWRSDLLGKLPRSVTTGQGPRQLMLPVGGLNNPGTVGEILFHSALILAGTVAAVELDKRIAARPWGVRPSVYAFGGSVAAAVVAARYKKPRLCRGATAVAIGLAAGMVAQGMAGG